MAKKPKTQIEIAIYKEAQNKEKMGKKPKLERKLIRSPKCRENG